MIKLHISPKLALPADAVTSTIVVYGGKGTGKRLALDTPLPTPTGWTTMGEVVVGDELFDDMGRVCRVTTVSETVLGDSYRVSFSDGSSIVADAEHLWATQDYRARKRGEPAAIRTTDEIRRTLLVRQDSQPARNHSIRTARPLCMPIVELPIDPYVLGYWLGDGSSAAATITSGEADFHIVTALVRATGHDVSEHRRDPARAPHFGLPGLKVKLRDIGVLNDKHVPANYLRASTEQRLSLLQGLLDSDGGVSGAVVRFDNKNIRLADAVYELVVSLGMRASRVSRTSRLRGVDHGPSHRVTFVPTLPVFRLPRKLARLRFDTAQAERRVRRYVVSVDPVPAVSMRCIAIDSPSQLYLAGRAMVPTHNTNLATVLVEEFAANDLRFAVIDPMGVLWGLRHGASGKGVGIKVLILGGIHGDLPITPESGALVADLVVDEDDSVVVDISRRADGSMWAIAERIRFVRDYARRLYQRQGERRRPIHQVIDEAARFAPQVVRQGENDVAACMGAIAVLVEEGRNVGIGVTLVTQRSARLNKDVAELADCMIAFRIVGPNSMRAVLDWLGEHVEKSRLKEIGEQLRSLPRGSALVVSPGWLEFEGIVAMRKRTTFDSSKTPEAGAEVRATGAGAKLDLSKYRQRLAALIEQQEANDPRTLRAKIAELVRERDQLSRAVNAPAAAKRTERPVGPPVDVKKLEALAARLETTLTKHDAAVSRHHEAYAATLEGYTKTSKAVTSAAIAAIDELRAKLKITSTAPPPRKDTVRLDESTILWTPGRRPPPAPQPGAPSDLKPVHLRILAAIAWWNAVGVEAPDVHGVAFVAGTSAESSSFENHRARLNVLGLIRYPSSGRLSLTPSGSAVAPPPPIPTTNDALHAMILGKVKPVVGRLLRAAIDAHPGELAFEELADRAGSSAGSSSFENHRSWLRARGLIEYPRSGFARATDLLFPEGASS